MKNFLVFPLVIFQVITGFTQPLNELKVTSISNSYPMFSPNGERLIFHSNRMGNYDLYTSNLDGSELIRLTDHPGMDRTPSWSPSGDKVAFVSTRDGNYDVFIMNADGSNQLNLTNSESSKEVHPYWSPDGSYIIFNSSRINDTYDVYTMKPDGSNMEKLRKGNDGEVTHAQYTPDGSKIVYRKFLGDGNSEIFIMNSNGTNEVRLTYSPAFDFHPVTNGSSIVFSSSRGKSEELYTRLYVMDMNGKNLRRITYNNFQEADLTPVFTLDGTRVFYSHWYNSGTVDIYSLDLAAMEDE